MVTSGIPPSIMEETVRRILWNTDLKWTDFQRKVILRLLENFLINVQCATMKYEIIRKPMELERVELNLVKNVYYY